MNKVVIFYGSTLEYSKIIPKNNIRNLTDLVMEIDIDSRVFYMQNNDNMNQEKKKIFVENFVIDSDEYSGVREHVIINFANFLSKVEVENLYMQNPPLIISKQIEKIFPQLETNYQKYKSISKKDLVRLKNSFQKSIIGQKDVCMKVLQALYPLTNKNRDKPVVMLFYGDTGLGKTETAQVISRLFEEKLFRKQFSMFQNNQFATYLFGGSHNERSFAKELLERESNVVLLDEFDKSNSIFHSAFYQLFDEGIFEDQNYYLELKKSIIICTSNYLTIEDIKNKLGNAIFSRFDAVIKFDSLSVVSKKEISLVKYNEKFLKLSKNEQNILSKLDIKGKLIESCTKCNNVREISQLIEDTFSLILIRSLGKL